MRDQFYSDIDSHKPLIFAHRGASFDAPQNTLAAFALARRVGADGVELDTSLTRDGVPVVIHDLKVDRTTDGHGLVHDFDLKAIKQLDAGSSHSAAFKGEAIPTLDEVFEALGADMRVNVELKSEGLRTDGLERAVLAVINRHNAAPQVIISSFNPFALRRWHAIAPHIPIGYLYSPDEPIYLRSRWLMLGVRTDALHPHHSMVNAAYMERAVRAKQHVNTWTVDDPARIVALRDLGVDAIITNRPDVALRAIGRSTN